MSKHRTLISGRLVDELDEPVTLQVHTKCPDKWMLHDLETGQVYVGTTNTKVGKQWELINKL